MKMCSQIIYKLNFKLNILKEIIREMLAHKTWVNPLLEIMVSEKWWGIVFKGFRFELEDTIIMEQIRAIYGIVFKNWFSHSKQRIAIRASFARNLLALSLCKLTLWNETIRYRMAIEWSVSSLKVRVTYVMIVAVTVAQLRPNWTATPIADRTDRSCCSVSGATKNTRIYLVISWTASDGSKIAYRKGRRTGSGVWVLSDCLSP